MRGRQPLGFGRGIHSHKAFLCVDLRPRAELPPAVRDYLVERLCLADDVPIVWHSPRSPGAKLARAPNIILLLLMLPAPCYAFPHPFNRQPCSNVSTSIHPEVAAARVLPRPCRLSPDMSPVTGPCAFNGRLKPCGTPEQGQRQEAHPQGMQSTDKKLPPAPHARCRRRSSMLTVDTHERKATKPLSCWWKLLRFAPTCVETRYLPPPNPRFRYCSYCSRVGGTQQI